MSFPLKKSGDAAWEYQRVENLTLGVSVAERSDQIDPGYTLEMVNTLLKRQTVFIDTGSSQLDTHTYDVPDVPMKPIQFRRQDGTIEYILISEGSVYKYNTTHHQWQALPGDVYTTLSGAHLSGVTTLNVADSTGFSASDVVHVYLTDGTVSEETVSGTGVGTIAISALDGAASNGALVVKLGYLSGDRDNYQVSHVEVPFNDWLVFTNQVDNVKRYDGTTVEDVPNLPSTGNTQCAAVAYYNAALFLISTVEGGTAYPRRVRRSDQGDVTAWTGGTSGYDDLNEDSGVCMCAYPLGPYLIVYKDNSIYRGEFIGSGGVNYAYSRMVESVGAVSKNAVVPSDDLHYVLSEEGSFEYRGGFDVQHISDAVFDKVFSAFGYIDPDKRELIFGISVGELDEVWFALPATGNTYCGRILRYSKKTKAWYERALSTSMELCGACEFQNVVSYVWSDITSPWTSNQWPWNSQIAQAKGRQVAMVIAGTSRTVVYDYIASTDGDGVLDLPIEAYIETKDFEVGDGTLRIDMMEGAGLGTFAVSFSVNEGISWEPLGAGTVTISVTTPGRKFQLWQQVVAHKIRFRFTSVDPQFQLRWIGFSWKMETGY